MKRRNIFLLLVLLLVPTIEFNAQLNANKSDTLDKRQKSIIPIAAFAAKGDLTELKQALNDGLDAGLSINETKELLVHLYAYAGFPRSLNAISTLEAVVLERRQKGINDVHGKESSKIIETKNKFNRGKEVQTKLTGSTTTGAPQKFVPIIDVFLKEHLFADIFSRDALDWKTREIVTISVLATLGGTENQLRSHFNVGLNTGLTEQQLKNIVSVIQTKVGEKEGRKADIVLQSVLNKTTNISSSESNNISANTVFPKGTKISNNNFTGTAWLHMLVPGDSTFNTSIANVTFEPGARTKWHYHPGGQLLLITSGKGRYGEKGKAVRELNKGDVIKCDPNIVHWHGAAPDSEMSHLAIGTNTDRAPVVWLQQVSDEEYSTPR